MIKQITLALIFVFAGLYSQAQCSVSFWSQDSLGTVYFNPWGGSAADYFVYDYGDGTTDTVQYQSPNWGNSTHVYSPNGTYYACVEVVDTLGCSATTCDSVVAVSTPCSVNWSSYPTVSQTNPYEVAFNSFGWGMAVTYLWDFGDGNTSTLASPVHNYAAQGVYYVCLTTDDGLGCTHTICDSVYSDCVADFSFANGAASGSIDFTNGSFPLVGSTQSTWSFGDGGSSTATSPTHQYTSPGGYEVCLTSFTSGSCYAQHCDSVSIDTSAFCNIGYNSTWTGNYFAFNPLLSGAGYTYSWDFGDGNTSTDENPLHGYATSGYYNVCLTSDDGAGCVMTVCDSLWAWSGGGCNAQFWSYDSLAMCHFDPNYPAHVTSFIYDYGDGTIDTIPAGSGEVSYQYATPGTYYVCLTVMDSLGCSDTYCDSVTCNSVACTAGFGSWNSSDSTNHWQISFWEWSSGNNLTYAWDFGDGNTSTDPNPVHNYAADGTYTVCLTIDNGAGCTDTYCYNVTVNQWCGAYFSFTNLCDNFSFTNNSIGGSYTSSWDFGDGGSSVLNDPTHVFVGQSLYNVTLTITTAAGCVASTTEQISVYSQLPQVSFNVNDSLGDCYFTPYLSNTTASIVSASWDFDDGATSTDISPVHHLAYQGGWWGYQVEVTVVDSYGCTSTTTQFVQSCVQPTTDCNADFTVLDSANTLLFINGSASSDHNFTWDFGDGGSSNQINPLHTYATYGGYWVTLVVNDSSCVDSAFQYVNVVAPSGSCTANYGWFNSWYDSTVQMYNASLGTNLTYSWDFGDGNTSNLPYPTHQYAQPGMYQVCLTIDDGFGCIDTYCDTIESLMKANGFVLEIHPMAHASTVNIAAVDLDFGASLYPNPTNGNAQLSLELETAEEIVITIYNGLGQMLSSDRNQINEGSSQLQMDLNHLESGMYFIQLVGENGLTQVLPIIKN